MHLAQFSAILATADTVTREVKHIDLDRYVTVGAEAPLLILELEHQSTRKTTSRFDTSVDVSPDRECQRLDAQTTIDALANYVGADEQHALRVSFVTGTKAERLHKEVRNVWVRVFARFVKSRLHSCVVWRRPLLRIDTLLLAGVLGNLCITLIIDGSAAAPRREGRLSALQRVLGT